MIILLLILALVSVTAATVGWLFAHRPLTVYAWQTRIALRVAGLRSTTVRAPVGPQTVFTGGKGDVLVLLHGAGDQAGTWFKVVPSLVKDHTLIVPDLAGHGDSAPRTGGIDVRAVLEGVEADIQQLSGGPRVTIAGNSLGAWMATLVAQRHPDWVERLILIDGGAIKGNNQHAMVLPRTRGEARQAVAQTRDPASPPVPDFVLDDIVRQAKVGPLARFVATASTMDTFVLPEEQLHSISIPVEIIWGASDRLMPQDYPERMRKAFPNATLVTLEHCGHVPQVECPDRLLAALHDALEAHP